MRKKPFRPSNDISQTYNSGVVGIFRVEDAARPGLQPAETLRLKGHLRYEEQFLGINRVYMSRQQRAEVRRLIRVPKADVSVHDVAITEDGAVYRIDTVQTPEGVYPPSLDLALTEHPGKVEIVYDDLE